MDTKEKRWNVLFTEKQIADEVTRLGKQIAKDYEGKDVSLICLLRGGVIFFSDLIRVIQRTGLVKSIWSDFLIVGSYGDEQKTSGVVEIRHDIEGRFAFKRNVIIIEDVLETEFTLRKVSKHIQDKNPTSLQICVLIRKRTKPGDERLLEIPYVGFDNVQGFLKGNGMDDKQDERGLPDIYVLEGSY